ncbi:hypothetical protein M9Y10_006753 [Tritrichomonas musculus]|uniref:Uncharacterized protein n=1 Tax=Tritrichomonas musculus TaxID=1915356 RepID=A0ABR2JGB0_9EUKA
MKVCGYNASFCLGKKSNNKDPFGNLFISPPVDSHIDVHNLLSFSIFSEHSVFIDKQNQCFALGFNKDLRINNALPKNILDTENLIQIKPQNSLKLISSVCGEYYTLYLFSNESTGKSQLVYMSSSNKNFPCFVHINEQCKNYLFGGYETAASVDSEGTIYIINDNTFSSPEKTVIYAKLPNNDIAICVAFCSSLIYVLGCSGRIFWSPLKKLSFTQCDELEGIDIVQLSGTYKHCLAVSRDGRVFALGSNENGELGIGKSDSSSQKFKQITSLQKYKIVSASAGFSHSLFLTSEGTVLACGKNDFGQLLLRRGRSDNCQFLPVETTVVSGASYCIAGNCISVVFTCDQLPQNMPNRPIENPFIKMKMQLDEALESARKLREENRKLIQQNEMFKNECIRLQQEISVVREENAKLKRTSHNDQNGTLKIERPKSSSVVIINKSNRQESNE